MTISSISTGISAGTVRDAVLSDATRFKGGDMDAKLSTLLAGLNDLSSANVLTELNKLLTCTTNKLTDARVLKLDDILGLSDYSEDGTKLHNNLTVLTYYSDIIENLVLNTTANSLALNSVTIPNLTNRTVLEAYAGLYITEATEVSGSTNYVSPDQMIQIDNSGAGGWTNAISMKAGLLRCLANQDNKIGNLRYGNIDLVAKIGLNDTIDFQWTDARSVGASLYPRGVQSIVVLYVL